MKGKNVIPILSIGVLVVLMTTYLTIAPPCPHTGQGPCMKCIWTHTIVLWIAGILIGTGVMKMLTNASVSLGINIVELVLAVFGLLVLTTIIGTCGDPTMPCNHLMRKIGIFCWLAYLVVDSLSALRYRSMSRQN